LCGEIWWVGKMCLCVFGLCSALGVVGGGEVWCGGVTYYGGRGGGGSVQGIESLSGGNKDILI